MTFFVAEWEVFPDLNRLRRGDDVVEIEPRVMAVLEELAREPGRVVTRDDLYRTVWSDVIVSDDALTRCIRELRRLLGDDARAPRYIETISKRGYRLIAPVARRGDEPPPPPHAPEVTVAATTLLGHHAEVKGGGEETITMRRENVRLVARRNGARYDVRTRVFAAATPLVTAAGGWTIAALLLYGSGLRFSLGIGITLIAAIAGWVAGAPARRRALDRSRAAIAAFARNVSPPRRDSGADHV